MGRYCDFLEQQEQSRANKFGAILKQLFGGGGILQDTREAIKKAKSEFGRQDLLLPDMIDIVRRLSHRYRGGFICGCLTRTPPKHRREFPELLREIVRVSPNTWVFLTPRPYITDKIVRYFSETVRI